MWVSGHFSEGIGIPPFHRQADATGYDTLVECIEPLWHVGYTNAQIAHTLRDEALRSTRSTRLAPTTVLKIRNQHHWLSRYHEHRLAEKVDGMWTIHSLTRKLGVKCNGFYNRICRGFLSPQDVIRNPPYGNYLIRNNAKLAARLHYEVQRTHWPGAKSQT